ncbi:MAG: T9SS type A sorting domain-containing protein [Flavobacteriales bacterium]|nr:MAG: T9SS type A sorting domain-containing protein [Flavobacteriales bacterium]
MCTLRRSIYAWYGGSGADTEIGSLEQSALIPTGTTVELIMMFKIAGVGDGTAGNYVKAYIDGTEVGMVTAVDSTTYVDYTEWAIDITSFANGAAHAVKIEGKENGTSAFNGLVDDVAIRVDGNVIIGLFENESLPGMSVYPNPANELMTLSFNGLKGETVVTMTDLNGKLVSTQVLSEVYQRTFNFATADLVDGVYVVNVTNNGNTYAQRVMVAH